MVVTITYDELLCFSLFNQIFLSDKEMIVMDVRLKLLMLTLKSSKKKKIKISNFNGSVSSTINLRDGLEIFFN